MLSRNEKGKLRFDSLEFEIFIGDLFEQCDTEAETDWLEEQLRGVVEGIAEEKRDGVL